MHVIINCMCVYIRVYVCAWYIFMRHTNFITLAPALTLLGLAVTAQVVRQDQESRLRLQGQQCLGHHRRGRACVLCVCVRWCGGVNSKRMNAVLLFVGL